MKQPRAPQAQAAPRKRHCTPPRSKTWAPATASPSAWRARRRPPGRRARSRRRAAGWPCAPPCAAAGRPRTSRRPGARPAGAGRSGFAAGGLRGALLHCRRGLRQIGVRMQEQGHPAAQRAAASSAAGAQRAPPPAGCPSRRAAWGSSHRHWPGPSWRTPGRQRGARGTQGGRALALVPGPLELPAPLPAPPRLPRPPHQHDGQVARPGEDVARAVVEANVAARARKQVGAVMQLSWLGGGGRRAGRVHAAGAASCCQQLALRTCCRWRRERRTRYSAPSAGPGAQGRGWETTSGSPAAGAAGRQAPVERLLPQWPNQPGCAARCWRAGARCRAA